MRHYAFAFTTVCTLVAAAQVPKAGSPAVDSMPIPDVNRQVLAFVDAHMGRRVGGGECWDLAAAALEAAHANWDGRYVFGAAVDTAVEEVLPGDIIQFEGVEVEYAGPNGRYHQSMPQHTAIVHATHGKGRYTLAHQNFGRAGRKVSLTGLELDHIVRGSLTVYRPVQ